MAMARKAIGHHCSLLERCELELLQRTTDLGVQALVRGCPGLSDLRLGGCAKLSNISTSLIADHCTGTMCRLGLGGLSTLNDVDLEDVGKITSLTWLDLCACPKVSDAGIKQVGLLAAKQMKAHALWEEKWEEEEEEVFMPTTHRPALRKAHRPVPPVQQHLFEAEWAAELPLRDVYGASAAVTLAPWAQEPAPLPRGRHRLRQSRILI